MSLDIIQDNTAKYMETKLGDEKIESIPLCKRFELAISKTFGKILSEINFSTGFCSGYLIISFCQIFSIVLDSSFGFPDLGAFSYPVTAFTFSVGIFEIVLTSNSSNWFYITIGIFSAYIMILLILFITLFCSKGYKKFLTKLTGYFGTTLYWVLFIPMSKTFLSVIDCQSSDSLQFNSNISCYSTAHIIWLCVIILPMVLLVILALLFALYCNETNPYFVDNSLSRFDWWFECLYWFYRIVIISMSVAIPKGIVRNSIVIYTIFIMSLHFSWLYHTSYPYYSKTIAIVFGICCYSVVWISIILVMKEIISEYAKYTYGGDAILIYAGIFLISKVTINAYNNKVYYAILNQSQNLIKTEEDFNIFIRSLISIGLNHKKRTHFENTTIEGYLFTHTSSCTKPDCPLNFDNMKKAEKTVDEHFLVRELIKKAYEHALEFSGAEQIIQIENINRFWPKNLLNYIYFLMHKIGNLHAAAVQLARLELSKPSVSIHSAISRIKANLRDLHEQRNAKKLVGSKDKEYSIDPRLLLEYEAKFSCFKDKMFKIAESYRETWTQLLSPFPDLNIVEKNLYGGVADNNATQQIKAELYKLHPQYEKTNKFFSMYLADVLGQEELAEDYLNRQKTKSNNEIIFAPNTVTIVISALPETLGNIIKASNGVSKLFEYSHNEIQGKNVGILMSQVVGDLHNDFMRHYLETGKRKIIDHFSDEIACDKQQFLFQIKLLVREYYDLLYGPIFVGLLSAYQPQSLILTDSFGTILGFSKKALRELGSRFSPLFVKEYTVKIWYIIPEMNWDAESTTETYESIVGEREVTFMIPVNLNKVLQKLHGNNAINKTNKDILALFGYDSELKKKWRCIIKNVNYQGLKLKVILFKPVKQDREQNINGNDIIDKSLDYYENDNAKKEKAEIIQEEPLEKPYESYEGEDTNNKPSNDNVENEKEEDDKENSQKKREITKKAILKELKILLNINYKRYNPFIFKLALRCALVFKIACIVVITLFLVYMLVIINSVNRDYEIILLERYTYILDISGTVSTFLLMKNYLDENPIIDHNYRDAYDYNLEYDEETSNNFIRWRARRLYESAITLITTQEILNYKTLSIYKDSTREMLNPNAVPMHKAINLTTIVDFNSLINMLGNQAVKVSNMPLENYSIRNPAIALILMNVYNNLWNLNFDSTNMMKEVKLIQDRALLIILIGVIVVSSLGVLFFFSIVPTWRAIIFQSIESIELMLKIKTKQLKKQIARCGRFMRQVSNLENEEQGFYVEDFLNGNEEIFQEKKQDEEEHLKKKRHKHRGHKYKGYKVLIIALTTGYGGVLASIIAYYVGLYLFPYFFNKQVHAHLEELEMLRYEYESRTRLHCLVVETIRSAIYEDMFSFMDKSHIRELLNTMTTKKNSLLTQFNAHKSYVSEEYKEYFRRGLQGSICDRDFGTDREECWLLSNGILGEGLYATIIYYLTIYQDAIEEIISIKNKTELVQAARRFLNSVEFIHSEVELTKYHFVVLNFLDNLLGESFKSTQRYGKVVVILLACIAYAISILVYFLPWRIYINFMREKLVKSKMLICQLPLNVIVHSKHISGHFFKLDNDIISNLSKTDVNYII